MFGKFLTTTALALPFASASVSLAALARQQQKPNMIKIMGDDIGIWNIGAYHHGLMAGRRRISTSSLPRACCSAITTPRREHTLLCAMVWFLGAEEETEISGSSTGGYPCVRSRI
jgi:hypothetical protein